MAAVMALALGYGLGCANLALWLAKRRGIDLRAGGTGNPGASNALLLMGKGAFVLVALHDVGKAVLAVTAARLLFPVSKLAPCAAGLGAVLGHCFPLHLKGKGGKGYAAYVGMILALDWRFALCLLAVAALLIWLTNYAMAGNLWTVVISPLYLGLKAESLGAALVLCAASALVVFTHRHNFRKIRQGDEPRVRDALRSR